MFIDLFFFVSSKTIKYCYKFIVIYALLMNRRHSKLHHR